MSTLIVGNGSPLIGKGLGDKINTFDKVVRINLFRLKGYEKDLGTKTDVHVVAGEVFRKQKDNFPWHPDAERRISIEKGWARGIGELAKKNQAEVLNFYYLQKAKDMIGSWRRVSTGFALILMYLMLDEQPIAIANFDFAQTGHYFNAEHKHHKHPWWGEKNYVDRMVLEGNVIVLG